MLHKETVSEKTLDILKKLMTDPVLENFILVGGTALSLRIGHRISIDLDMFTNMDFDQEKLNSYLQSTYHFSPDFIERNTLKGSVEGVALDLISHKYKYVDHITNIEGVRLGSLKDIAAMKLNAIINNGTREKDFIDVAFLGESLSFNQMAKAFEIKYDTNPLMATKALLYHKDIRHIPGIKLLPFEYDFDLIKKSLENLVREPDKTHSIEGRETEYSK